jgi:hypothetical protein
MTDLTSLLLITMGLLSLSLAFDKWRTAFLGVVLVGFAQDPLRKIAPGEPVYFVVLCTGMMALALMSAMRQYGFVSLTPLSSGDAKTRNVLALVVAVVAVQAVLSWFRYGSVMIAAIGLLSYLSPIAAVWLAYYYSRTVLDIQRFLTLYVIGAVIVTAGIYFSKMGVISPLLGQVGEGIAIYDIRVGKLDVHSGLMRSPEVAAWHAGVATCVLVMLAVSSRTRRLRIFAPILVLFFLAAAVLTGRRKVLVLAATFLVFYFVLLHYFRHRTASRTLLVVAVLSAGVLAGALAMAPSDHSFQPYIERGQSAFGDASDRLAQFGLTSVGYGIYAGGFFGLGAGVGSQGTQYFAGGEVIAGGPAEGGLGKIVVELGVPGLLLIVLAVGLMARNIRRILGRTEFTDASLRPLCLGLTALCAANVPIFLGASQIYGDPFVLMLLGSFLGFVLAVPRLQRRPEANRLKLGGPAAA